MCEEEALIIVDGVKLEVPLDKWAFTLPWLQVDRET
jgi:hypothetical protein